MKYLIPNLSSKCKTRLLPLALLCSLLFTGCKKLLDIESNHAVSEANMWNSHEDTRAALIGVYGLTRAALANNNAYWMYGELRSGDFSSVNRQDLDAIINNNLHAPMDLLKDLSNWRRFYAIINAANLFLEHVGEVKARDPKYSEQNMNVDIAQVRFLRAYAYFWLVRIWGDAPLITTSHDGEFADKAKDSQDKILAFIEQEMQGAANVLPYKYSSGDVQQQGQYYNVGGDKWNDVLVKKTSVYAVMAHVAAWQGKYSLVEAYTRFVLDNAGKVPHSFMKTDDLTKGSGFFTGTSKAVGNQIPIWCINSEYAKGEAAYSGHLEELTLAAPVISKNLPEIYVPKDTVLKLFDQLTDERFALDSITGFPTSDRYFTAFSNHMPIFSKIKVVQDGSVANPNYRIFASAIIVTRMEELTLLRAEALAVLGNTQGAIDQLNQIRDLRKIGKYNAALEGDLVDAIFKERRKELIGEGWRWFDIIRYNKIKHNDPAFLKMMNEGGIYWPIADDVLSTNHLISQQPYWLNR
ncbi:Starch-binding associating with outer membrane [Chitinophaga terrae (ex Kim and Jung 2007)]|uniref:Starch-binding associating with outer membrane n=1 Tax=Chitinophaga terrae (ex Kim and Jung 2007) TaxID=408074 RepID=A0A1H4GAM2_9BACT|nr:RagB/SusD family nutrient uptake outer membrane protein [Chitinophaga terrae (ex Kim and Jung 2007)]GEP93186.1 starch-binding protein [Chitinophaga terrae (ex Kim and Jung 2007)]SEB06060.1 Starch-binding associating with outer membrane [Chitinophaga terrae (ex Kim and Jung 2007)]